MNGSGRLSSHTEKKADNWSVGSKKKLKASMRHKMKRIYVGILDAVDKEKLEGKIEEDIASRLRAKILNMGNDQIRNMEKEIDDKYNVEFLNYHVDFRIIPE